MPRAERAASARVLALGPLALALFVGLLASSPGVARAEVQVSTRLFAGCGAALGTMEREFLFELGLRGEVLFGAPGDWNFRIGPAFELREVDFDTFEFTAGVAGLLPVVRGWPIVLTAAGGYALRRGRFDSGPVFVGTFAWGYRSYNYHSAYGLAVAPYASARVQLEDASQWELMFGVEIDLEALVGIPYAFFRSLAHRGPPDE